MDLLDALKEVKDHRSGGKAAKFNGFLEDLISIEEDEKVKTILEEILEVDSEAKVMKDFSVYINPDVVANRVMGYKDIYKIPKWYIKANYIIYSENEQGPFAMILSDRSYYEAKGIYYSLTERDAFLENYRRRVFVMSLRDTNKIAEQYALVLNNNVQTSVIQREQDRRYYSDMESLIGNVVRMNEQVVSTIKSSLEEYPTGRAQRIHDVISSWFLMKKTVYVTYMMDKRTLQEDNGNDIKEHRRKAKVASSQIEIVPFSEMWRQ